MKLAALISTILIGTSTAAMAQPMVRSANRTTSYTQRAESRDHRDYRPRSEVRGNRVMIRQPAAPVYTPSRTTVVRGDIYAATWSPLTDATYLDRSRGGQTFDLCNVGTLRRLRLNQLSGAVAVTHVEITFANGQRQTALVNQTLQSGNGAFDIDLQSRSAVQYVTVFGASGRSGTYQLLGV